MEKNIFGDEMAVCSTQPLTGFYRDGCCNSGEDDLGTHTVCAIMTEDFLNFSYERGNDLITPRPQYMFTGLKPGDKWCLCVLRWKEALEAGVAPQVYLEATNEKSLEYVSMDDLIKHAHKNEK